MAGSSQHQGREQRSPLISLAFCGISYWVMLERMPIIEKSVIDPIGGFACLALVVNGALALSGLLQHLADYTAIVIARTPVGVKGSARFARLKEIKHELSPYGAAPYWGSVKGVPLFSRFEASAFIIAPSGGGKTTSLVITNILALAGVSKTVIDFKSELTPMLVAALLAKGETVRIVNLGDLFADRLHGISDCYNVLHIVSDCFERKGSLRDISDILYELCLQIYPEPAGGGGKDDNRYFRDGSRRLIAFCILCLIIVEGERATLGGVLQLLGDRKALLHHALWCAGRLPVTGEDGEKAFEAIPLQDSHWAAAHEAKDLADFTAYFTGLAEGVASLLEIPDNRTLESFLNGALDKLSCFNVTTRAHAKTATSTFRFHEQKEGGATTVFIMLDPNKTEAQAPVLGLVQWGMLYETKNHPDKSRPVYLVADEATNIPWAGVGQLMTFARGFGLRLLFIFQTFAAFKQAHGAEALEILLSEAEIICLMKGQRNPDTLAQLEKWLGNRPLITQTHNGNNDRYGIHGFGFAEDARPVLTADELRRIEKGILIIRRCRPILVDHPSIAEIRPWAKMVAVNPFHNKPYIKKARLRIPSRKVPLWRRALWAIRFKR